MIVCQLSKRCGDPSALLPISVTPECKRFTTVRVVLGCARIIRVLRLGHLLILYISWSLLQSSPITSFIKLKLIAHILESLLKPDQIL